MPVLVGHLLVRPSFSQARAIFGLRVFDRPCEAGGSVKPASMIQPPFYAIHHEAGQGPSRIPIGPRLKKDESLITSTGRVVYALILREMATTYGRSPGGFLWAVLEPVAGIALLSIVLSVAFVAPPLGNSFLLFYATGLVPFLFYNDLSTKISQSINFSRPLLAYPRVTFVDALIARFTINFLAQLAVAITVFIGIVIVAAPDRWPDWAGVGFAFFLIGAFGLSVGVMNCYLLTRFPIWQRVWTILNRPLFVISCIFFLFEGIPERFQNFM